MKKIILLIGLLGIIMSGCAKPQIVRIFPAEEVAKMEINKILEDKDLSNEEKAQIIQMKLSEDIERKKRAVEAEKDNKLSSIINKPVAPLRTPDTILRVLILPYEDDKGVLNGWKYSYVKVDDGKWIMADYLNGTRPSFKGTLTPLKNKDAGSAIQGIGMAPAITNEGVKTYSQYSEELKQEKAKQKKNNKKAKNDKKAKQPLDKKTKSTADNIKENTKDNNEQQISGNSEKPKSEINTKSEENKVLSKSKEKDAEKKNVKTDVKDTEIKSDKDVKTKSTDINIDTDKDTDTNINTGKQDKNSASINEIIIIDDDKTKEKTDLKEEKTKSDADEINSNNNKPKEDIKKAEHSDVTKEDKKQESKQKSPDKDNTKINKNDNNQQKNKSDKTNKQNINNDKKGKNIPELILYF